MPNLNRVMLMGNLTRDIEDRSTANCNIASFGMAINRTWKNQSGEKQEETTFVDVTAFGKVVDILLKYVRKGDPIYIDGRLHLEQWQDKDGNNRQKLGVIMENMQLISTRSESTRSESARSEPARQPASSRTNSRGGAYAGPQRGEQTVDEDEIPF